MFHRVALVVFAAVALTPGVDAASRPAVHHAPAPVRHSPTHSTPRQIVPAARTAAAKKIVNHQPPRAFRPPMPTPAQAKSTAQSTARASVNIVARPASFSNRLHRSPLVYANHRSHWRSSRYTRRSSTNGMMVTGIVRSVSGGPTGGIVNVQTARSNASRFRPTGAAGNRSGTTTRTFLVNTATSYQVISRTQPRTIGTFNSLQPGETVLIVKQSPSSNNARLIEVFTP